MPVRPGRRLINAYVDEVVAAADVDRRVCARLLEVIAPSSAPVSLFSPAVLVGVAAARPSRGRSAGRREPAPGPYATER